MSPDSQTFSSTGSCNISLLDLTESDKVFREKGEEAYREFQRTNEDVVLGQGVAFQFVKRLLGINTAEETLVEVVLLSKNDPDTGLRVFNSID